MIHCSFIRFICVFGVFHKGLTALIQTQQTVIAAVGGEALLSCQLIQSKDVHQVTWFKLLPEGRKKNLASYHKVYGQKINPDFRDKVKFKDARLQSNSIIIRNVTEKDEGCYQCLFNTYPEGALNNTTCVTLDDFDEESGSKTGGRSQILIIVLFMVGGCAFIAVFIFVRFKPKNQSSLSQRDQDVIEMSGRTINTQKTQAPHIRQRTTPETIQRSDDESNPSPSTSSRLCSGSV